VLVLSDVDWGGHWVWEQQVSALLSESRPVLYVEQSRTVLAGFAPAGGDTPFDEKRRLIRSGVRSASPNLLLVSPPLLLPFRYLPVICAANQWRRARWVNALLRGYSRDAPAVLTFEPDSRGMLARMNRSCAVYVRNDNHARRGLWFNPDRIVARRERALIRHVDAVVALSQGLAQPAVACGAQTHIVPNGVDARLFRDSEGHEPQAMSRVPRPRIGVVGMLDRRTDVRLLETLAVRHAEWSLVMVGPVSSRDKGHFVGLRSRPNVHFLGAQQVADLPGYIGALDVGLIPYVINEYTRRILSLKIFEYSAMGVPTIATPMPELLRYAPNVSLCDGATQFERRILDALCSRSAERRAELIRFAEDNTWATRAKQVAAIIESLEDDARLPGGGSRPRRSAGRGRGVSATQPPPLSWRP
jgi:glycosyltransferase involved in cell wall biosynthesis